METQAHLQNLPHRVFLAYRECRDRDWAGTGQPMADQAWDLSHGQESVPDTISGALFCLQTGAWCGCPLRALTEATAGHWRELRESWSSGSLVEELGGGGD